MLRQETIVYADVPGFPAGTTVAAVRITYTDASGNHQGATLTPGEQPSSIDLPAGDWTCIAEAMDASGVVVFTSKPDSFTLENPATISLNVPTAVSGV